MKKVLLDLTECKALGDNLCATPTIRKLFESYNQKIVLVTYYPELFRDNPYVEKTYSPNTINFDYLEQNHIIHRTFDVLGNKSERGVENKHSRMDIRQYHTISLGFMLTQDEMECDFYPSPFEEIKGLPEKYVLIHPVQNWPNRTWSSTNWMLLTKKLNDAGFAVVSIGKESSETGFFNIDKPTFNFEIKNGLNLINKTSLSQAWHVIQKSSCFITMDTGLLHLAGTTDANIFLLGSAINPEFRKPYRNGSQDYKLKYILGGCDLHCASDMKHNVKEWGTIQGVPPIIGCLENKKTFECHPTVNQVFELLIKTLENE
jgi:ADP-heptose:LPS heptosyltransferase